MAKRRGNKEGTIYLRKNGRWSAQLTVEGRRICFTGSTQREAQDWLMMTRNQVESGLTAAGAKATLRVFLSEWLATINTSLRPKTWGQYSQVVRQHILPELGKTKLKDLRPDQIQSFYNRKMEAGTSPSTVRIIHAVLHKALGDALRWGLIPRNPVSVVLKPKVPRTEMKVLSADQVRQFLISVRGDRNEALYHVAVSTGLRQGEILGLMWSDLDWETGRLQIQRQVQRAPAEGLKLVEPKSAAGRRLIVLGPSTLKKLLEHSKRQRAESACKGKQWQEQDLIFPSTIGTPMEQRRLHINFKKLLRVAGLPEIRFHDLRHTAATLMLQQGIHPKVVQERLGHSQISVTLDTYSHVLPAMQEEAAIKIDELISPIAIDLIRTER